MKKLYNILCGEVTSKERFFQGLLAVVTIVAACGFAEFINNL